LRDLGIYAVDSMRLDKCYRSWKADLEIGFTPFDASLDRFVDLDKASFVGRDAVVAEHGRGSRYRFVPMTLDAPGDADAPFCSSIFAGDRRVGIVTSAGWSFTLGKSIALGYVERSFAVASTHVQIEIFGNRVDATVQSEPLYDPTNQRSRA
jgi:dimethylglycine dehydrogenase